MSANKIQLTKNDESVLFTFTDSKHYLTGNGRIEVPLNSLSLVIDSSDMVTFRKAASNDIFVSAPISDFGMSKAELEEWYAENMVDGNGSVDPEQLAGLIADAEYISSATTIAFYNLDGDEVCHIDATDFIKDGMVENVVISGSNLVITWNTSAGKQPISIPLTDIFNPSNYYDKTAIDTALSGKQDTLIAGTNIKTLNNESLLGSGNIDIDSPISSCTQAEYDAAEQGGTLDPDMLYIITDASAIDIDNYMTSAQTESAITEAVSGKADTSAVTAAIDAVNASLSGKADTTLVNAIAGQVATKVAISTYNAYTAATDTALSGKADVSAVTAVAEALDDYATAQDLEDTEEALAQSINVLSASLSGKQDTLQYYSEDTENNEGGIGTSVEDGGVTKSSEVRVASDTDGDSDASMSASEYSDDYYKESVFHGTQDGIEITYNSGDNVEGTSISHMINVNGDGFRIETNSDDGELTTTTEFSVTPDGVTINNDAVVTVPMLSGVTPCVFDFGRAATLGITDADWNGVMDAYVNHKPIIAFLGIMRYVCESLVLNTDASDNQVFTFTVSDDTSRYILDVTNLGNSQYQITRYDTIALPTTNDITNWNGKQDTLIAGSGITISGNVISATASITVDNALSSGSTNPVQNAVIYSEITNINDMIGDIETLLQAI